MRSYSVDRETSVKYMLYQERWKCKLGEERAENPIKQRDNVFMFTIPNCCSKGHAFNTSRVTFFLTFYYTFVEL